MTILQLNPPIPLMTPKGEALAHLIIDYGIEHDLCWVTFIKETGECWAFRNADVRACKNITIGRSLDNIGTIGEETTVSSEPIIGNVTNIIGYSTPVIQAKYMGGIPPSSSTYHINSTDYLFNSWE